MSIKWWGTLCIKEIGLVYTNTIQSSSLCLFVLVNHSCFPNPDAYADFYSLTFSLFSLLLTNSIQPQLFLLTYSSFLHIFVLQRDRLFSEPNYSMYFWSLTFVLSSHSFIAYSFLSPFLSFFLFSSDLNSSLHYTVKIFCNSLFLRQKHTAVFVQTHTHTYSSPQAAQF